MLAIVAATLTNTMVFNQRSAHQTVLRHLRREIPEDPDPLSQLLHGTSVVSVMDTRLQVLPSLIDTSDAELKLPGEDQWCLLERDGDAKTVYFAWTEDAEASLVWAEFTTAEEPLKAAAHAPDVGVHAV